MPFIAEKLAENAVHRNAHIIDREIHKKLYDDREWLEKIVEDEARRITREFMKDTLAGLIERMEANVALFRELAYRFAALSEEEPDVR